MTSTADVVEPERVAVTSIVPLQLSEKAAVPAESEIVAWSSSTSVSVVPVTVDSELVPAMPMVSLPSLVVSWVGVRVKLPVPLVAFAAIVMSKSDTAA